MEIPISKDRECGECSVCCTSLRIEIPELKKLADTSCQNLSNERGCSIYNERPNLCRHWLCGWMVLDIPDNLRPDISGVLIRLDNDSACFQPVVGCNPIRLILPDIARIISFFVSNDFEVSISIPTKKGFCYANFVVNEHLKELVETGEYEPIADKIKDMILFAAKSKTDPITPLS
ncbi:MULTISPECIES: YkgJ family cysteine cluster protein [Providencia]|uniref:YkgJ family cysteine cluster protein n=1 Tax=Providencia TaxID=586 RepID=UPI0014197427|nr:MULTISPECIES: hypothetical protein [Providencia]NIA46035.1 hypothetical protein [Providencia rettgeri]NIA99553.1 hypothetical protein [Providencia rettgeri]NIB17430.1 hypothetical protein [Providencia rettgeri]NIB37470.1 hypothetical protein [Providencia rettgeri]NIL73507.1 hypothetical protein [Providencia sp. 504mA]